MELRIVYLFIGCLIVFSILYFVNFANFVPSFILVL